VDYALLEEDCGASGDGGGEIPAPLSLAAWMAPGPPGLDLRFAPDFVHSFSSISAFVLGRILKIKSLLTLFQAIPPGLTPREFAAATLRVFKVGLNLEKDVEQKIPKDGPLVIVSNHPFGALDGVALLDALLPFRPDLKIMVNVLLGIFPDLRPACLPLDILSPEAAARNMASLRLAASHLRQGGALLFFPSGTVSHWQKGRGIVDPPWQMTAARFAMRHKAAVLPVFFQGRNSLLFNAAGSIHPLLRTLLLPREMIKRVGSTLSLKVGRPIEAGTFRLLGNAETATSYMRMRCYALASRSLPAQTAKPMAPVAEPHSPQQVVRVFVDLPQECLLLREGDYAIYSVRSSQSPLLMEELGSLREFTFRLAGEGSGKSRDLDIYDERYHHLLLWNEKDRRLAGAYRLGKVREILAERGEKGLYTTSLFRMSREFFQRYGNALELGRAVIHPQYQREYAPLMLLWKGIGSFILRHDDIRCLFGPVSLSLDYSPTSLRAVVEYLQEQCGSPELASMVRGRKLPDRILCASTDIPLPETTGYNGLVALVRDIEGGKGIPILFKHYLKLGGKIGAFHLDTTFHTLDAFLMMDLVDSPRSMLERYMTREGAERFLSSWKK
jgi:putative hemolysin